MGGHPHLKHSTTSSEKGEGPCEPGASSSQARPGSEVPPRAERAMPPIPGGRVKPVPSAANILVRETKASEPRLGQGGVGLEGRANLSKSLGRREEAGDWLSARPTPRPRPASCRAPCSRWQSGPGALCGDRATALPTEPTATGLQAELQAPPSDLQAKWSLEDASVRSLDQAFLDHFSNSGDT